MADWKTLTHPLAYPFTVGEGDKAETITEIVLREPDMEAVEALQEAGIFNADAAGLAEKGLSVKQVRVCLVALSGKPDDTIKRLHFKDVRKLSELLGPLFEELAAGEAPSNS